MDHSNIIDLNRHRKLRKIKLTSFAFRVQNDESAYNDALKLLIFTCSFAVVSFFLIFYAIYKFVH